MTTADATAVDDELVAAFHAGGWGQSRAALAPAVVRQGTGTGRRATGAARPCRGRREAVPVSGTARASPAMPQQLGGLPAPQRPPDGAVRSRPAGRLTRRGFAIGPARAPASRVAGPRGLDWGLVPMPARSL